MIVLPIRENILKVLRFTIYKRPFIDDILSWINEVTFIVLVENF